MSGVINLPQYLNYDDESTERRYQELFNLILTKWFNTNGFFQPSLTSTQVSTLMGMTPPPENGTHWLNTTLNKMQFIDATGVVQTVTSA